MSQLEVMDLGLDEDGDPITSVVWTHLPDATPNSKSKEASHEQIVWDFIRDHDGEFQEVGHSGGDVRSGRAGEADSHPR